MLVRMQNEKYSMKFSLTNPSAYFTVLAFITLAFSWLGFVLALKDFVTAVTNQGIFWGFISAGFGFFGLLAFGAASVALLLAVKANLKERVKVFLLFKVTLFCSLVFLVPILLSSLLSINHYV